MTISDGKKIFISNEWILSNPTPENLAVQLIESMADEYVNPDYETPSVFKQIVTNEHVEGIGNVRIFLNNNTRFSEIFKGLRILCLENYNPVSTEEIETFIQMIHDCYSFLEDDLEYIFRVTLDKVFDKHHPEFPPYVRLKRLFKILLTPKVYNWYEILSSSESPYQDFEKLIERSVLTDKF